jgi:hypothetical protein
VVIASRDTIGFSRGNSRIPFAMIDAVIQWDIVSKRIAAQILNGIIGNQINTVGDNLLLKIL